ncbi:matrixin family metalloprotease [Sporosarcina limicola]|uniref:Zn-dependent protease n=1 Tax=Sporosarcina limicola TaxID=34101 RepID=A0A927R5X7_9BACL|nr:putative Zn-dependent protease [Sporosarcina limicola]
MGEGQISTEDSGPTQNYNYTELKLNHSYLYDDEPIDIQATAMHEFGHALGLAHSSTKDAIMYKNRDRNVKNVSGDDIQGIRHIKINNGSNSNAFQNRNIKCF